MKMKLKSWHLYVLATLCFLFAFTSLNMKYDRFYRVNGIDNDNRSLIEKYLDKEEQDYLIDHGISVDEFIDYITYWEFVNALSYVDELEVKLLVNSIKEYSKAPTFNKSIKKVALSSKLDKYFINHKGIYSITNKVFDKVFSLLCLCKLYYFAGAIHLLRLKRANKIQVNAINLNGGEVFE